MPKKRVCREREYGSFHLLGLFGFYLYTLHAWSSTTTTYKYMHKEKSFWPSLVKKKYTTECISIEGGTLLCITVFSIFRRSFLLFSFISNFKPQSNPREFQEAIQFLLIEFFSSFSSPTISPLRLFMGASFQIFNSSYFFSRCYLFKMEKNCFQTLKLFFVSFFFVSLSPL